MKLYYYKDKSGNFGDDLNEWLWPRLFGDVFDEDDSELFVGIGTILNHGIPGSSVKHVFGSGFGYGKIPSLSSNDKIYFVRGPLTAEKLGLKKSLAITDGGILIKKFFKKNVKAVNVSIIPHHVSENNANWQELADAAGYKLIKPSGNVEDVINDISNSKLIITESMHGAIIADALRIKWIPYIAYEHVSTNKWIDWCMSHNIEYTPLKVHSYFDQEWDSTLLSRFKTRVKRALLSVGLFKETWSKPCRKKSNSKSKIQTINDLVKLQYSSQYLSDDMVHKELFNKVLEKVEEFKRSN